MKTYLRRRSDRFRPCFCKFLALPSGNFLFVARLARRPHSLRICAEPFPEQPVNFGVDPKASSPGNSSLAQRELSSTRHWLQGFRAFLLRGNVVDLAVGVMIGAAFGKIVTSFVNDIITPPLGLLLGRVKFSELKWSLGGPPDAAVTINYGVFIQNLIDFVLVALALFALISLVNRLHRKPPPPAPELSLEQKLLTEIRDELRKPPTETPAHPAPPA